MLAICMPAIWMVRVGNERLSASEKYRESGYIRDSTGQRFYVIAVARPLANAGALSWLGRASVSRVGGMKIRQGRRDRGGPAFV